jgi:hypothetical protein
MDGPSHFAESERLLAFADRQIGEATVNTIVEIMAGATLGTAMAQVHATLALAAATAESESEVLSAAWAGALR